MPGRHRQLRGPSEEEDSHNYIEDESEAITLEEESEPYEYNYKDVIFDYLYSKRVFFSGIAVLLVLSAIPLWNLSIVIVKPTGKEEQLPLASLSFSFSIWILLTVALEYCIEKVSLSQLRRARTSGAFWYYVNELSFFISFGIATVILHGYLSIAMGNFYVKTPYDLKFNMCDILKIILITILWLGVQKAIVKRISMSFNYNIYINRIKKCILFDFFLTLINNLDETDGGPVMDGEFGNDDESTVLVGMPDSAKALNTFIFEKKFRSRDAENLSLDAKRILLKEFQDMMKTTVSYSGSLPAILGKIRSISASRANKLVRKLIRTAKIDRIGDIGRYFKDQDVFEYILDQLGMSKDEKIERSNVVHIIEKAYKERFVINRSIEQVNAAIDKVAFCGKIGTFVFAAVAIYISAIENKSTIVGVVSTIFGAQFLNKIISENVIQSIMFLFVIHPFDIGDRVLIKLDSVEENLLVAELNVFSTLFYRWDGTSVFIPNYVLANHPISNVRRSGPMMETHSIQINASTDPSKLYVLKQMLLEFVRTNSEIYTDYVLVNYEKIEDSNKLFIKVLVQYQTNCQNYESYLKKRSCFIIELNRCLRMLDITYTLPVQKVKISKELCEEVEKSVRVN
ncbi:mechanosensitive ion channel protein 4/5/6/7/8/9/10 [Pancytospora epiphaga]|nr:mechanosensitive ion channel protein 4/5/6/7/8/9/10 [Pancytospora epiphaga]